MPLILDAIAGPAFGRQFALDSGTARCGRASEATWSIEGDVELAPLHFAVRFYASKYYLIRVAHAPLTLNSEDVDQAPLVSGDRIHAGQSVFLVRVTGEDRAGTVPLPAIASAGTSASVLSCLQSRSD